MICAVLTNEPINYLLGVGCSLKVDIYIAGQEIPWLYGTKMYITVFTKAYQWTVS
jgi:hypothetical protein